VAGSYGSGRRVVGQTAAGPSYDAGSVGAPIRHRAAEIVRRLAGSLWVRAVVSTGLLVLVGLQIDFGAIQDRLADGSWGLFAAAVAALFASFLVGALRWHIFLQAAGLASTRRRATGAYLVGTFTTNFLPTQFGGDVTRAIVVTGRGTRTRSATTVVLDRATALACMIVLGWLFVAIDPGPVPGQLIAALAAASAAFVLACALIVPLSRLVARRPSRVRPTVREVKAALVACLTRPVLARTLLIGLGFQGLVYLSAWLVARSVSIDLPLSVLGAVLAPVLILSAAPVSIGGFGVREGSYVFLLGYAGVSATDATLFSLLTAAVFALASLPGALVLLSRGARSARPAQPENREQERREEDLDAGHHPGRSQQGDLALAERAGSAGEPVDHSHDSADEAPEKDRASHQ
jgi:glycosyltransferase 2 family protein